MGPVRRVVVVVGGGTAGYFAALALKRQLPDLDVTLVESALTQADALGLQRRRPDLLEELVTSDGSWVTCGDERITGVDQARGLLHARPGRQKRGPYARLLERVSPPRTAPASPPDGR